MQNSNIFQASSNIINMTVTCVPGHHNELLAQRIEVEWASASAFRSHSVIVHLVMKRHFCTLTHNQSPHFAERSFAGKPKWMADDHIDVCIALLVFVWTLTISLSFKRLHLTQSEPSLSFYKTCSFMHTHSKPSIYLCIDENRAKRIELVIHRYRMKICAWMIAFTTR